MKKINTRKLRIITFISSSILFLTITSILYIKKSKSDNIPDSQVPVTQPAPESLMHYSPLEKKLTRNKATFFITDNGDALIKDEFNNEYRITTDGSVYKIEKDKLIEIDENDEKKFILEALDEASDFSGYASVLKDTITENGKDSKDEIQDVKTESDKSMIQKILLSNNDKEEKNEEAIIIKEDKKSSNLIEFEPYSMIKSLNSDSYEEVNNQKGKNEFINNFKSSSSMYFLTENDIAPATIIPITIISGLNSDLPGEIIAQVSTNIYDNLTQNKLLIPKGTVLLAKYDSQITYGQNRVLIAWTTLIRHDGLVALLPGFQGVDNLGRSGYVGKVDNHIGDIIKNAGLSSLIDIASLSASKISKSDNVNTFLTAITNSTSESSKNIISKASNRQPTITIDVGKSAKVLVNKKITLPDIRVI